MQPLQSQESLAAPARHPNGPKNPAAQHLPERSEAMRHQELRPPKLRCRQATQPRYRHYPPLLVRPAAWAKRFWATWQEKWKLEWSRRILLFGCPEGATHRSVLGLPSPLQERQAPGWCPLSSFLSFPVPPTRPQSAGGWTSSGSVSAAASVSATPRSVFSLQFFRQFCLSRRRRSSRDPIGPMRSILGPLSARKGPCPMWAENPRDPPAGSRKGRQAGRFPAGRRQPARKNVSGVFLRPEPSAPY